MKIPTIVLIALIAAATLAVGIVVATYVLNIPGSGTVITSTVLTASPSSINLGNIMNGSSVSTTVKVTNTGDVASEPLTMAVSGLPSYLAVTWDVSSGTTIAAGAYRDIIFTTTASPTATEGAFSFNIVVNG